MRKAVQTVPNHVVRAVFTPGEWQTVNEAAAKIYAAGAVPIEVSLRKARERATPEQYKQAPVDAMTALGLTTYVRKILGSYVRDGVAEVRGQRNHKEYRFLPDGQRRPRKTFKKKRRRDAVQHPVAPDDQPTPDW
jgi:hypothetical protein